MFSAATGLPLGVFTYTIWTGQWTLALLYGLLSWIALTLWLKHEEEVES